MARLPSKHDLSGPSSLRSGRAIASEDMSGLARGIQSFGASLGDMAARIESQHNAVDIARAEAFKTEKLLAVQNDFDADPDYSTFDKRAPARTEEVVKEAANLIRDPTMRERWFHGARSDAARVTDGIRDKGFALGRQAETVAFDEALESSRRVYVDPDTPDDLRDKARADIEASIEVGESSGLFTPEQAQKRRELYLDKADFSRGSLAVERDPTVISAALPEKVADRASMAMRYYQSRGWTKEQAAGIVGNLLGESSLNTGARNPGDGVDGSDSIGIGQWNADRSRALKKYAAENKADWRDFNVQLAFVDHELRTSEKRAAAALKNAATIDEATAAFVGYERPQGWSAANPRGAHNFKGRLKFAMQAAGEKINPDWYDRLAPEQRQALDAQAEQRQREMVTASRAQAKAEYETYKDRVGLDILTGRVPTETTILNDPVLNDGDKATLLRSFRSEMEKTIQTQQAVAAFTGDGLRVDPYDGDGRKTVDNVYDAVTKAAPENIQPITEELVRQTGVVPKQALSLIRQGLTSTDVNAVTQAAQAAQRISSINPAAIARRDGGKEVQDAADDFSHYVNNLNLSPEEAAQRLRDARDPEKMRDRKALEPAAKEFMKDLDGFDLAAEFDDSFLGLATNPEIGFDPGTELGIMAEFRAIAEDQFYRVNGDPELAKNRALEQMKRLYGVTDLTGRSVVMKHPPERYWPKFRFSQFGKTVVRSNDASIDYAVVQLKRDMEELFPNVDMDRVQLVTTPETDREVKAGRMPGYAVMYRDENGTLQTLPGQLWKPDLSMIQDRNELFEDMERNLREESARKARPGLESVIRDRIEGMDREKSLDDFLDGDPLTGER